MMIVHLVSISQGEKWLNANKVIHPYGGGYTHIYINGFHEPEVHYWSALEKLEINGEDILKGRKE